MNKIDLSKHRYKGSQALVATPSKYEMDDDDQVHTLVIKNVSLDDADEYIVRATNDLGSKTSRACVIVDGEQHDWAEVC